MYGLAVEHRKIDKDMALSKDLAKHIPTRLLNGKIAIVTDQPIALLSSVRKQWVKLIRQAQRERSSVLGKRYKLNLDHNIERLQDTMFTAKPPIQDPVGDISFATVEQFLLAPPICYTLYLTCDVSKREQHMLASWMPPLGLVVVYERRE
jgi:hypothetical protein